MHKLETDTDTDTNIDTNTETILAPQAVQHSDGAAELATLLHSGVERALWQRSADPRLAAMAEWPSGRVAGWPNGRMAADFAAGDAAGLPHELAAGRSGSAVGQCRRTGQLVRADDQRFEALMKDLGLVPAGAN